MDRTIRYGPRRVNGRKEDGREIKSSLDYAIEHRRRKRKKRHPRPLLREIGFAEISFIVLAVAVEFLERTLRTSP